jgi:hypothetical protein
MKAVLLIMLAAFAVSVSAQAPAAKKKESAPTVAAPADAKSCDLTWTYKATNANRLEAEQSRTVYGLTAEEVNKVQKRGDKVLDAGSMDQDKGGPITLVLGTKLVCDGKVVPAQAGEIELRGMTLKDANKFNRASNKIDIELFDDIDAKEKAGKKRAFGKD